MKNKTFIFFGLYVAHNAERDHRPCEYLKEVGLKKKEQAHVTIQHKGQPAKDKRECFTTQRKDYFTNKQESECAENGGPYFYPEHTTAKEIGKPCKNT